MIEKMKFLSITGPMGDIDRVAEVYLSRYEIQLENALSELKTVKNLRPFIENNPYKEDEQRARTLVEQYQDLLPQTGEELSFEKALETVRELDQELKTLLAQKEELEKKRGDLQDSRDQVWPFAGLDYDINRDSGALPGNIMISFRHTSMIPSTRSSLSAGKPRIMCGWFTVCL